MKLIKIMVSNLIIISLISFIIGGFAWPYFINSWLIYYSNSETRINRGTFLYL